MVVYMVLLEISLFDTSCWIEQKTVMLLVVVCDQDLQQNRMKLKACPFWFSILRWFASELTRTDNVSRWITT